MKTRLVAPILVFVVVIIGLIIYFYTYSTVKAIENHQYETARDYQQL